MLRRGLGSKTKVVFNSAYCYLKLFRQVMEFSLSVQNVATGLFSLLLAQNQQENTVIAPEQ